MRIRKRQVHFPLSSLSPVPLSVSDPRSSTVQLNPPPLIPSDEDDTAAYFNAPSSSLHQFQPIQLATTHTYTYTKDEGEGEGSYDTKSEKMDSMANHEQSDSLHQVGKWFEEEKAFPVKKRRGSWETKWNDNNKKTKKKMKKKLCMQQNGNNNNNEDDKESKGMVMVNNNNNGKKRGRGGVLMEGSRCSRVNGRGWRCCQQTLVGYSLCEHHLGKGRLRSMTSVRSRSKGTSFSQPLSSSDDKEDKADRNKSKDDLVMSKKPTKTKLGFVKARSMSSLLGQHDNN